MPVSDFWEDFGTGSFSDTGGDASSVAVQVVEAFGLHA